MADEMLNVMAGLNLSVEIRCPYCQSLNKYQALTSVHSKVRSHVRDHADKDLNVDCKCEWCDRWVKIVKVTWM